MKNSKNNNRRTTARITTTEEQQKHDKKQQQQQSTHECNTEAGTLITDPPVVIFAKNLNDVHITVKKETVYNITYTLCYILYLKNFLVSFAMCFKTL